jgi:hypothetical protein
VRTHQEIDRRSLVMVRRIVAKIDADPERRGLEHAKAVCERWVSEGINSASEWLQILQKPWDEVRAILLDESDEGQRLRQTDPFCGILTPAERWQIYREFSHEPPLREMHVPSPAFGTLCPSPGRGA